MLKIHQFWVSNLNDLKLNVFFSKNCLFFDLFKRVNFAILPIFWEAKFQLWWKLAFVIKEVFRFRTLNNYNWTIFISIITLNIDACFTKMQLYTFIKTWNQNYLFRAFYWNMVQNWNHSHRISSLFFGHFI